jgi:hypothetical protein
MEYTFVKERRVAEPSEDTFGVDSKTPLTYALCWNAQEDHRVIGDTLAELVSRLGGYTDFKGLEKNDVINTRKSRTLYYKEIDVLVAEQYPAEPTVLEEFKGLLERLR